MLINTQLISQIKLTNPWLEVPSREILTLTDYIPRLQADKILSAEWDKQWIIFIGPRRSGKTIFGKYVSAQLKKTKRFDNILYLNCDYYLIRQCLDSPQAVIDLTKHFGMKRPIVFIDEVQRLENPGLLLKMIADLELPIKMIATGSSQLEIRSKVQEFLTGRQLSVTVLPLSCQELGSLFNWPTQGLFGSYPQVVTSSEKNMQLEQLYEDYIKKDIVDILKVGKPDILQKLIVLIAHSSGQLVNFNQLACDCGVTIKTVQNYLSILEKTFVLCRVMPFVGNKRTEITSNPIYYFIDNGFRNNALGNFSSLESRNDRGLLIQNLIFQELLKLKVLNFLQFSIYYWRTKSGAEVDFVLFKNFENFIPIEVKFQNLPHPAITRGFRSFLTAYQPPFGIVVNKNLLGEAEFEGRKIYFFPIDHLDKMLIHIIEKLYP